MAKSNELIHECISTERVLLEDGAVQNGPAPFFPVDQDLVDLLVQVARVAQQFRQVCDQKSAHLHRTEPNT